MTVKPQTSLNNLGGDTDEALIVDRIFSAVLEQRLAPNTKLSEPKLCESFGVGRMRVRRALLLLASQGIVVLPSNKSAHVACPNPREANEVFQARKLIETGIVRDMSTDADPSMLSKLRRHIDLENAARTDGERSEIIRLSGEFHVELAQAHGNTTLCRVLRELVTRTSLIVGMFGSNRYTTCPEDEHAKILDAIASGNPELAGDLVCHHLQHIQDGLDLTKEQPRDDDLIEILGSP